MIRRPPRSTLDRSSAASDVYKRQVKNYKGEKYNLSEFTDPATGFISKKSKDGKELKLSLIHISEPTRPY